VAGFGDSQERGGVSLGHAKLGGQLSADGGDGSLKMRMRMYPIQI
jgi:hypothetical protein